LKLTLRSKILLWFAILILIAVILYGFLIFFVYRFNLMGERYMIALNKDPGQYRLIIDRLKELNYFESFGPPHQLTILPPELFMRIFFTITGGVLAIIIISVSGGYLVLRRMMGQIDFITSNVREIDEKRLHLRLNLKGKDAISKMGGVFDGMLDKIENSFKNQKQFIQNASHELNTPLTVIKTKIDLLKQKKNIGEKDYKSTIELIDSEIMRLSGITEELLTLSDLEENNNKREFNEVNLKSILNRMLKVFENQINSKDLKLKIYFNGEFKIWGSKLQMEQLLLNLLDNAIKYSVSGSELKINLKNIIKRKLINLTVTNTSMIIKREDLPYIFKRFYKKSAVNNRKSFGLGLSISKKIVENHSGSIKANYDEHRKEITFKVFLPSYKKV